MGIISVLAAAAAAWVFGAIYYMALARPWVKASGVPVDADGKPRGGTAAPFVISFICMIFVAGMMRHSFAMAGVLTPGKGALAGLGIGAFFIMPWIVLNNAYGMRPMTLSAIDGGYAAFGCAIMGAVLTLF